MTSRAGKRQPKTNLSPAARPEKTGRFAERWIDDELILVPIQAHAEDADSLYTLNGVGGRIWELIDGARNVGEIAEDISDEYRVTEKEALKDVVEFLDRLLSADFLKLST